MYVVAYRSHENYSELRTCIISKPSTHSNDNALKLINTMLKQDALKYLYSNIGLHFVVGLF